MSALSLCLHFLWESRLGLQLRASYSSSERAAESETRYDEPTAGHIVKHGGNTIFAFKIARLIGCLVLLGFSSAGLASDEAGPENSTLQLHHKYLQAGMCALYVRALFY